MSAHQTRDAIAIARRAYDHAIRLGHRHYGAEHFLLALAGADEPAGAVLREFGVTPERVEAGIARVGLLGDLDRDALAGIGIDVDAVYERAASAFGREAIARAATATVRREPVWSRRSPRRRAGASRHGVFLPHDDGGLQGIGNARRESESRPAPLIDVEDLALGFLAVTEGPLPTILAELGVSAPALSAAIADRYRQVS